jgi:hypothetical protein
METDNIFRDRFGAIIANIIVEDIQKSETSVVFECLSELICA